MPAPFGVTGVGTFASGVGAISPGLPEVWDRDLLLMFLESQDTTAVPAVTGWADVTASPVYVSTGTPTRLTCRWTYGYGGMTAPTVPDAGDHLCGVILGVRGQALQGNPWNITAAATDLTATTAVSVPGAVTTLPGCLVVVAVSTGTDTATGQITGGPTWTNANLTGLTSQANSWAIAGGGGGIAVATGTYAGTGNYGATTATLATANFKACLSIAIRPAQMLSVPTVTVAAQFAG